MRAFVRELAISRAFWVVMAVATLALHAAWARNTHSGANLARCGALWAIFGAALLARPIIRLQFARWYAEARSMDDGVYDGTPEQEAATIEANRQDRLDAISQQMLGPVLIVAGTLLWGYGDLVGDWLFACRCR